MAAKQGKFCWYELMTTDAEAALAFYGDVVGWTGRDAGQPVNRDQQVVMHVRHLPRSRRG